MRWLPLACVLATASLVASVHFARGERGPVEEWHRVRTGALARVDVERALYELDGLDHLLIRVRVTNLRDDPIGIDVSDYWRFIRPNQVGGLDRPERGVIDESRTMPSAQEMIDGGSAALRDAFAAGRLVEIPADGARDVYVDFNGGGREIVDTRAAPYVFVSLDGELRVTNGRAAEQITLEWGGGERRPDDDLDSDLILETPVRWRTVPAHAITVLDP